ncbi:hypothetical protein GCM10010446_21590 [Streptomyces enissocaesilis]|uniref:Uncharacterized protein n=1 Tax=Streptomyces enissocaesilis TaxID=332589 RepID=A0ABP6JLY7_9ACTN
MPASAARSAAIRTPRASDVLVWRSWAPAAGAVTAPASKVPAMRVPAEPSAAVRLKWCLPL